jgi:hypothetical protein
MPARVVLIITHMAATIPRTFDLDRAAVACVVHVQRNGSLTAMSPASRAGSPSVHVTVRTLGSPLTG